MFYVYPKPGDTTHEYSIDGLLLTMSCLHGTYIPGTETLSSMHWHTCRQGIYIDEMCAPGQKNKNKRKQSTNSQCIKLIFIHENCLRRCVLPPTFKSIVSPSSFENNNTHHAGLSQWEKLKEWTWNTSLNAQLIRLSDTVNLCIGGVQWYFFFFSSYFAWLQSRAEDQFCVVSTRLSKWFIKYMHQTGHPALFMQKHVSGCNCFSWHEPSVASL